MAYGAVFAVQDSKQDYSGRPELWTFKLLTRCDIQRFMPALRIVQGNGSSQGHTGYTNDVLMDTIPDPFVQNLFVLCHGEQVILNNVTDTEAQTTSGAAKKGAAAARPWDPPLTARGKLQAWRVGRKIRLEDWNVTRVVVSPFLRCVQTAVEVIAGLCLLPSSVHMCDSRSHDHGNSAISVTSIKASIEGGLAENLLNKQGILPHPLEVADEGWFQPWTLDLAELYSMLPTGTRDPSFQPIKQKLPLGRESMEDVQYRYTSTLEKIANRYPHENILCITHGEGVGQSVSMMWPPTEVHAATYCAYTHAQRPVFEHDNAGSDILNDDWELLTESGSSSGVFFSPCR